MESKKSINDKILIVNAICKHKNGIRKQIKKQANKQKRRKTTPTHNNTNSQPAQVYVLGQLNKKNVGEFAKFSMLSELKD